MTKKRLAIVALLVAVIFGVWVGNILRQLPGFGSSATVYNTATLLKQVQTLSQLVTVKYVMEKVVVLEVPADTTIGKVLGSQNKVILLAHGIVKAGIDLNSLKPEDIQMVGKKIVIKLPPAQITDAYLDERQTQVLDRNADHFAPSDKDLEQTARQNAVDDIRRAARSGGILKDADDRAREQLKNLFKQLGFEEVEIRSP